MRKAQRIDGRIILPPDPTDEEWDYALEMHTPREREELSKTITHQLKWAVWRLRHPRWAVFLDAAMISGMAIVGSRRAASIPPVEE